MYDIYICQYCSCGSLWRGGYPQLGLLMLKKHKIKIIGTAILGSTYDLRNYICYNIFSVYLKWMETEECLRMVYLFCMDN